ncbi:MAG: hypothetical protein FJ278_15640, partial [Planctomycetes bacterium]|nr:hypothetical protein [Planctomycetota bacterium]
RGSFGADDVAVSGDTGTAMRGPSDAAISAYAPGTESDSAEWQTVAAKTPSLGGQVAAKAARQPETSEAPTDVDLLDASDTGASADDDLTNLDNSAPAKALQFEVFGTLDGATVTLYSDGTAIGSAVAGGSSAIVTTNGSVDLTDGDHRITARQTEPGKSESDDSTELAVTVDTVGPRVTDMAPIPGSVAGEGAEVVVSFSEELHDPTVDETTVRVAGLGLDSQYGTPDDVLVDGDIVYDLGTDTVTFTPWDVLSPGGYGVWLKGTSSIRDVAGNRLDGEYAAAFPSGNGQPGGDFLALFQVSTAESAAPTGVDLLPASDTGAANDDDVTNLNNSGPGQELRFQVSGTVAGAMVTLYSDGDDVPIGEAVAVGATTGVTTDGLMDLADGEHFVTARQTEPGKPESDASPDLPVTIDTQGPQVTDAVFSQDVEGGFNEVVVSFDEALDEASVTDATMKVSSDPGGDGDWGTNDDTYVAGEVFYDAGGNAATFTPTDPPPAGIYALWLDGGASIRDLAGNTLDGEYDGDFPSGDGTPGGHFAMVFDTGAEGGVLRPLDAQRPVQFRDASGDNVTVTLQGPGTGTVVLPEGGDGDALRISLTRTTARSSLLIATKSTVRGVVAGTSVGDILITGSLKNLSAPTTDLVGSLTVVR